MAPDGDLHTTTSASDSPESEDIARGHDRGVGFAVVESTRFRFGDRLGFHPMQVRVRCSCGHVDRAPSAIKKSQRDVVRFRSSLLRENGLETIRRTLNRSRLVPHPCSPARSALIAEEIIGQDEGLTVLTSRDVAVLMLPGWALEQLPKKRMTAGSVTRIAVCRVLGCSRSVAFRFATPCVPKVVRDLRSRARSAPVGPFCIEPGERAAWLHR